MTYFNYLGQPMPETALEQSHVDGTTAGNETVQAPAGNSSIAGDGGGDLLIGSSGDNTFFLDDPHDRVQESPGGGIDTEVGWTSIALAANVENLVVHQDFNYAIGNSLDNLIVVDGSPSITRRSACLPATIDPVRAPRPRYVAPFSVPTLIASSGVSPASTSSSRARWFE